MRNITGNYQVPSVSAPFNFRAKLQRDEQGELWDTRSEPSVVNKSTNYSTKSTSQMFTSRDSCGWKRLDSKLLEFYIPKDQKKKKPNPKVEEIQPTLNCDKFARPKFRHKIFQNFACARTSLVYSYAAFEYTPPPPATSKTYTQYYTVISFAKVANPFLLREYEVGLY